jgi:hypothetical protein
MGSELAEMERWRLFMTFEPQHGQGKGYTWFTGRLDTASYFFTTPKGPTSSILTPINHHISLTGGRSTRDRRSERVARDPLP